MFNKIRLFLILNSSNFGFVVVLLFTIGLFWLFKSIDKNTVDKRQEKITLFTNQSNAIVLSLKEKTGMIQSLEGNVEHLFGYDIKVKLTNSSFRRKTLEFYLSTSALSNEERHILNKTKIGDTLTYKFNSYDKKNGELKIKLW